MTTTTTTNTTIKAGKNRSSRESATYRFEFRASAFKVQGHGVIIICSAECVDLKRRDLYSKWQGSGRFLSIMRCGACDCEGFGLLFGGDARCEQNEA